MPIVKGIFIVTEASRAGARKHAKRIRTCTCGKVCHGNGGWSSHKRACSIFRAAIAARKP